MASDWEVPPAPTVIIPTKPVRTDYATFRDALTRLEKAEKQIIPVVTDGNMARRGERAMILAMRRAGLLKSDLAACFLARQKNTEQSLILLLTEFTA